MIRTIGVVVPVANEEALLPGCLASLHASVHELQRDRDVTVHLLAVLDACLDDSAAIAAKFGVETIAVQHCQVGSARRDGAQHVLRAVPAHPEVWLASTDADSRVPRDWLSGMVELADGGADVVLGTVRPAGDLDRRIAQTWYARHVLGDDHPHIHAANLGIRADTYRAAGGWPTQASGEDEALVAQVAALDRVRIARTSRFPVATSTRLSARAPYGFSSYLRGLSAASLDGESA